ncbi:MAG TPA: hypothetical protein VMH90_03030 [Thermoplasmata archaeon]|nr:hypothetical protein [Thermoplasmata archaeon]
MNDGDGTLLVGLPEPVGRRARLGPFLSGRDALKFAGVAAVGAVVADATTPLAWLPFLGAGLLVGSVRLDGKGPDVHVADYLRWRWRRHPVTGTSPRSTVRDPEGTIARLPDGRCVAVLRSGGLPIGFLPSRDARVLFEGFRSLLRAQAHGLLLRMDAARIDPAPFRPRPGPDRGAGEGTALAGYRELIDVVSRARRRRQVDVMTWSDPGEPEPLHRLEDRVQALQGSLLMLGLSTQRLRGTALGQALTDLGLWGRSG